MAGVEKVAEKVATAVWEAVVGKIQKYVRHIQNCGKNLGELQTQIEKLYEEKYEIDKEVITGKEQLEVVTYKANRWLGRVPELTKDKTLYKLMIDATAAENDIRKVGIEIAKVWLKLMMDDHNDLKEQVKNNSEVCNLIVNVMKDINARKQLVDQGQNVSGEIKKVFESDKEVADVLEKLMRETIVEFKEVMKKDTKMAIAAMHILDGTDDFEKLTKEDEEMAGIIRIAKRSLSRKGEEECFPSDQDENAFKKTVMSTLQLVSKVMMNKALMKDAPNNVKLVAGVVGDLLENSQGLLSKADHRDKDDNCYCCATNPFMYFRDRHDMSVAAEVMVRKIESIMEDVPLRPFTRRRARAELEDIPSESVDLQSRKELLKKIVKALQDDNVQVVGAHGMGGSGKTALGKDVANSRADGVFDRAIMVEISESPNVERIQDQIVEKLGLPLKNVRTVRERAVSIYNGMKPENSVGNKDEHKRKKTLIILDNVWQELNLKEIGIPREYCKILMTSREKDVCKAMDVRTANMFEVGLLNATEAKELFQCQTELGIDWEEYSSVTDRLLKKCGGLPLSIVTTARALKGKDLAMWQQFANDLERPISCQFSSDVHQKTFSILRTSYEAMGSEEKKNFFLLACLAAPVGSSVAIDNLMRYGIGLDIFQHVNKLSEAMHQAHRWAEELKSSSMLLEGDFEYSVKVHDVVRECAISLASKTDAGKETQVFLVEAIPRWICNESFNKYFGIALLSGASYSRLSGVRAYLLQILLLQVDRNETPLDPNFFLGMTNLKVLTLLGMNFRMGLPDSLGGLRGLKTLRLESCRLGNIALIGCLGNLLVLSLQASVLEAGLANEISMLSNLRILDLNKCQVPQPIIPVYVINSLSHLEGLYLFDRRHEIWESREWILTGSQSDDARASMAEHSPNSHLNVIEMIVQSSKMLPISCKIVDNLDKFKIFVNCSYAKDVQDSRATRCLRVAKLYVNDDCLMALLKKANHLYLDESNFENIVPEIAREGLKDLHHLTVTECKNVRYIVEADDLIDSTYAFRSLECLELSSLPNLRSLCDGLEYTARVFSNLRHLSVELLSGLKYLLPCAALPCSLITISVHKCSSMTSIFGEEYDTMPSYEDNGVNRNRTIELPCLVGLALSSINSLSSMTKISTTYGALFEGLFGKEVMYPSLENLNLRNMDGIVKLWEKEANHSFKTLKSIRLSHCSRLESLGSPSNFSALELLEVLYIDNCEALQEVITRESPEEQDIIPGNIKFQKLRLIDISDCEKLECFYGGSCELEFPCLKELKLKHLGNFTKFALSKNATDLFNEENGLPCLEELTLIYLDKYMVLMRNDQPIADGELGSILPISLPRSRKLSRVTVNGKGFRLHMGLARFDLKLKCLNDRKVLLSASEIEGLVWTYSELLKVEELTVSECESIEKLFDDENEPSTAMLNFCGQLTELILYDLRSLKPLTRIHPFHNLHLLYMDFLSLEYAFSADMGLDQLHLLEVVKISKCHNMKLLIKEDSEDKPVIFPGLKVLELRGLASIISLTSSSCGPVHFQSLETLLVCDCNNLQVPWSRNFAAPKLKSVKLDSCNEMLSFLSDDANWVMNLPSLLEVQVLACSAIKWFSSTPVIAPKLKAVDIQKCNMIEWFLPGNTCQGTHLELLRLADVTINGCPNMRSFSPAVLMAPNIAHVECNWKDFSAQQNEDFNQFLRTLNDLSHGKSDESEEEWYCERDIGNRDEGEEELSDEGDTENRDEREEERRDEQDTENRDEGEEERSNEGDTENRDEREEERRDEQDTES